MVTKAIRGERTFVTPAEGTSGTFPGALIDSLDMSFSAMPNNTTVRGDTVGNLDNTVYDDGVASFGTAFVQTMPGTGWLSNTSKGFIIPAGADGRYDIEFFFYLLGTATSFPVQWGVRSDVQDASGTYIQHVVAAIGSLTHYSGMSNSAAQEARANVTAQGIPMVAGDRLVWFAQQNSGANRTIDYVRFSIKKVA